MDEAELAELISVYESGRLDEAERACRSVLAREQDQLEATYLLGRIQLDRSDAAAAIPLLRSAAKLAPDWPEVQANLGAALFMRGKLDEAAYHMRLAAALDPEDAEAQNNLGVVLRAGGRAREAEAAFLRALELRPDYPEALSNLGGTLQAVGRRSEAMERFRKALMLGSQNPEVLSALGEACLAAGDLDAAESEFGRLLTVDPASSRALAGLASVQAARSRAGSASECVRIGAESLERGDVGMAETAFRQALGASPENAQALKGLAEALLRARRPEQALPILENLLGRGAADAEQLNLYGLALRDLGKKREAVIQFRKALELAPDNLIAAANLAYTLGMVGDRKEAIPICRRVLTLWPDNALLHNVLGGALAGQGDIAGAMSAFQEALRLDPCLAAACSNLAAIYISQGKELKAVRLLRRALSIDPNLTDAINNLAAVYMFRGRRARGEELLRRAIALDPDSYGSHFNLGLSFLACEQYAEGWAKFEYRVRMKPETEQSMNAPKWRGESNPSGTLFVYAEQGLGDNIQFVRYLEMAKSRWQGRIVYCPYEELASLFEASELPVEIVPWRRDTRFPVLRYDAFISLMSLPWLFRTDRETIPATIPYLYEREDRKQVWRNRLHTGPELRVGLAYWGSRSHRRDRDRSCPVSLLAPLAGIAGVRFYSLQVGPEARQLKDAPAGLDIVDLGRDIHDFADTAAILQQLDLLISVDSAPAHLAGALGRPVWTLLPYVADWRWQIDREDTPWYPTMRLFRQPKFGAWAPVWDRVAQELRSLVEARRSPDG